MLRRFSGEEAFRSEMWRILCEDFFQQFVPINSVVVEVGAGYCEFINHVKAARRIAVDLNPDVFGYAGPGIEVIQTSSTEMGALPNGVGDIAFASNFFEHLERSAIQETIRETSRVLKPGGKFLILQPNIRFCQRDYWMFFDHITPLDDRSLSEALEMNGFHVEKVIVRFLPYTTKGRLPNSLSLLRLYLRLPLMWQLFGAQSFLVARNVRGR